VVAKVKYQSVA